MLFLINIALIHIHAYPIFIILSTFSCFAIVSSILYYSIHCFQCCIILYNIIILLCLHIGPIDEDRLSRVYRDLGISSSVYSLLIIKFQ